MYQRSIPSGRRWPHLQQLVRSREAVEAILNFLPKRRRRQNFLDDHWGIWSVLVALRKPSDRFPGGLGLDPALERAAATERRTDSGVVAASFRP